MCEDKMGKQGKKMILFALSIIQKLLDPGLAREYIYKVM